MASSQLTISLTGDGINLRPTGVQLNYTYNEIPFALVSLQAEDIKLLCNFDAIRRKKVTITVCTAGALIKFEGLTDGLSMSQTVGSIGLQLVVKNSFQVLKEVYPRLPGMHPSSMSLFRRADLIKFGGANLEDYFAAINLRGITNPLTSKNVIDFYIASAKAFVEGQQRIKLVSNVAANVSGIIKVAEDQAKVTLPLALEKLGHIDTSWISGMTLNASNKMVADLVIEDLVSNTDNLFNSLIKNLETFGCVLVVGNSKAWIVPEAGFLKINGRKKPGQGEAAAWSNVAFPSQYTSVEFNDNGYRDIKACYVVSDANVTLLNNRFTAELGYFIDENATGGVLTVPLPLPVAIGGAGSHFNVTKEAQKSVKNVEHNISAQIQETEAKQIIKEADAKLEEDALKTQNEFVNNWAQLKYLQAKYMDRIGSISMKFNARWAPAAIGTLYTRHPGTYIDFFVTSVTHRFAVAAPNSGTAETTINFNCGRMGASAQGSGLDKVIMYDYDAAKSLAYAEAFVVNNGLLGSDANQSFE